jgi:ADP-heptose:LPS heptosyltransferase
LKKVLVIRFSSIGDIVLTTPVIRALKTKGRFTVHCLVKEAFSSIYETNPYVDKVHKFDGNLKKTVKELQKEGFYFIVDLQNNLRSLRIKWMLQKPDASFPKLNIKKWLLVNLKINLLPETHIVDRYFEAVRPLGLTNDFKGLDFFIEEKENIKPVSIDKRLQNDYVAFVIGGKHNTKIFPAEKVAAVINKIDYPVVLLGGKEDTKRGSEIVSLCSDKTVIDACGKLSLQGSASLVKKAKVVVTNDTGLMHVAAAFNKPVISIWGNTVPAFGMTPYEPQTPENVIISEVKNLKCRPCSKLGYKKCPKKHFRCMMNQDEDFIAGQIKRFFSKQS